MFRLGSWEARMVFSDSRGLAQPALDPALLLEQPILLGPSDRKRKAARGHGPDVEVELVSVPRLIEAQALRTPAGIAVACRDQTLSYDELNTRADDLARQIVALGVGPEKLVAVNLPRSEWLIVALLAVLKAGGAYLPIDPEYPPARIALILDDAAPVLVLAVSATATGLVGGSVPCLLLDTDLANDDLTSSTSVTDHVRLPKVSPLTPAYVIYTSGSTGRPKGVVVLHGGLVNLLRAMSERFPLTHTDRWLAVTTIAFDIASLEVWLPLISGATVVIADRDIVFDAFGLSDLVESAGITVMQATPSLWQSQLSADPDGLDGLRMLVGGEALPAALARDMAERAADVNNGYGPTETTIYSTMDSVPPNVVRTSIGRPIQNTQVYVLDPELRPLQLGKAGELYIAGAGLARGYLNRAALTAERFVANPFGPPGSRMYRTGDLARWQSDERLDYLGRTDHQVKVRGFRIELGEVERVLSDHDRVAQAAVVVREDCPGHKRLVGYVVPAVTNGSTTGTLDSVTLRRYAEVTLPGYMVPGTIVFLDLLPLTPNGKLDRRALPAPELLISKGLQPPSSKTEGLLCQLFAEVLGLPAVGTDISFFDLGGDSIAALRLVSLVRKAGLTIKARDIFTHPRVGQLANVIRISSSQQSVWHDESDSMIPSNQKQAPASPVAAIAAHGQSDLDATNPFETATRSYTVLINGEGQYSLWPVSTDAPNGWTRCFGTETRQTCLEHISRTWTDMRPLSLAQQMRSADWSE